MYLQISNFKPGLDTRRSELTSVPGALEVLQNAHINQGGEVEKRFAFALQSGSLGTNTFGMCATPSGIFVFGSVSAGSVTGLPANFVYQQCAHPNGSAMTAVLSSTLFGNYPFVVAQFASGDVLGFYNGALVYDFVAGVVLSYQTTNTQIATMIATLVNQSANYTAVQNLQVLSAVTGTSAGLGYSINDVLTVVGGTGTVAQLKVTSLLVLGAINTVSVVNGGSYTVLPTNPVSVTGGTGSGANFNLTTGLNSALNIYSATGQSFNFNVAYNANNTGSGAIGVSATNTGVAAVAGNNAAGQFVITNGDSTGTITVVSVNGVSILNTTVAWTSSNANTAALVAASINANGSSNYTALASGSTVIITAKTQSTTQNGYVVSVTCTGALVIGSCVFALAFTASYANNIAAGTYNQNFITDGNGVSLLGSSYSNPASTGTGVAAPNLPWNSLANVYKDLVYTINNVSGGVYNAYSDNATGLWVSKRVTTSTDSATTINVAVGTYFVLAAVTGVTQPLSVTVNPTNISLIVPFFGNAPTVSVTASALYGVPPYTITWQIISKTITNLVMSNQSGTFSTSSITGVKISFTLNKFQNLLPATNSDSQAVLVTVTDSQGNTATTYLSVVATTP